MPGTSDGMGGDGGVFRVPNPAKFACTGGQTCCSQRARGVGGQRGLHRPSPLNRRLPMGSLRPKSRESSRQAIPHWCKCPRPLSRAPQTREPQTTDTIACLHTTMRRPSSTFSMANSPQALCIPLLRFFLCAPRFPWREIDF